MTQTPKGAARKMFAQAREQMYSACTLEQQGKATADDIKAACTAYTVAYLACLNVQIDPRKDKSCQ